MIADAETLLRGARRPLVIGMGGGGDVVGALATAEAMRLYDHAEPFVGGVTWERRPIDPVAGPRRVSEIAGGWEIAPGILLAGPHTRVRDRDVHFAESRMAAYLGRPTVLIDIYGGPAAIADGLGRAITALDRDLTVFIDVGGDVLAQGGEPGLRSPLCDAVMLAAAQRLAAAGRPVLLGIFGIGCDSELTAAEVLERISWVAGAGGLCGVRGLTEPVARRLEESLEFVPTEASAQAVRAFRGVSGTVAIRGGAREFELSSLAAQTSFLDVEAAFAAAGPLARAVAEAETLEDANRALNALSVRTELDLERRPLGSESMARAVGIPEPGGPEVLTVIDRSVREPGEGEVRIAVAAAAVNPTDIGLRAMGADGIDPPWTPGMDAAGTIESVGPGVNRLAPGDVVMAAVSPRRPEGGAQAELLVAPVASVVPIPDGASVDEAATLPMNGLTAMRGLELLDLADGETLAVAGGAGLLSSYVIGLAHERGLRVIADAKTGEEELVRAFGADVVVPRSDDFAGAVRAVEPAGVAAVYDTALLNDAAFGPIRDGGGLAVVRGWQGDAPRGIQVHRVFVREVLERTEWLDELRRLAGADRLKLRVAAAFPPEQAAEAQQLMDAGGLRGRALITF